MEKTICVIETGSFLCWIPYRWTDILVLDKVFSDSYDNIGRNQASVRYIRDNGSDGSDDDDDGDNESDDDSGTSEHRDRFLAKLSAEWEARCHPEMVVEPEPKLLALWNAFRNIPREHFSDVTAVFAESGIQFDCFGDSRPWILAIRDAAKVELKETGLCEEVLEDDL